LSETVSLQGAAREVNDRVAQLRVDAERDELDFSASAEPRIAWPL